MIGAILLVMAYELLCALFSHNYVLIDEIDQSQSMGSMLKVEVQALSVSFVTDSNALLLSVVLENELLQEEECPLVSNLLPDLDLRLPQVRRVSPFAVVTLQILDYKLHYKLLLQNGTWLNFLLH